MTATIGRGEGDAGGGGGGGDDDDGESCHPPGPRYRSVNVDGQWGDCYRVYHTPPATLAQLLGDDRGHEPLIIVYQPAAQPILTDAGLAAERHIEMFLADGTILGPPIDLAAHGDRSFYRQPTTPVATVVVYDPANETRAAWSDRWESEPVTPEAWRRRPYMVILSSPTGAGKPRHWQIMPFRGRMSWSIMAEPHTPRSHCHQPWPCAQVLADRAAADAMAIMEEDQALPDGCCWGCREPITTRQKTITFDGENLFDPLHPPASFHLRRKCRYEAGRYERRWLAADPIRKARPSCPGHAIVHVERRPPDCTEGPDCPGPLASHRSWEMCYVRHGVCLDGCAHPTSESRQ